MERQFTFYNPTKVIFGRGSTMKLAELMKDVGKNILLVYGGGSIKRSGLYDKVMAQLEDKHVIEMGGVEPNPHIETAYKGIALCKEHDIDFILGVGGGSVTDTCKVIGWGVKYDGDVWDFFVEKNWSPTYGQFRPKGTVPVGCITTLSGTGSEMNANAVMTNPRIGEKVGVGGGALCFPRFAICDPENTMSVSAYQTASGAFDIMAHVFEHYFSETGQYMPVQDGCAEGIMRCVITETPVAIKDPGNYEARANLMWAAGIALQGVVHAGRGFGNHMEHTIEHYLGARYDCAHGAGLALIAVPYRRYMMPTDIERYKQFAVNVFGVDPTGKTDDRVASEGLDRFEDFIASVGLPVSFREIGMEKDEIEDVARCIMKEGRLDGGTTVGYNELVSMFQSRY